MTGSNQPKVVMPVTSLKCVMIFFSNYINKILVTTQLYKTQFFIELHEKRGKNQCKARADT